MDKVIDYPTLIRDILSRHVELCNRHPTQEVENFLVVDEKNHHYIWMNIGWQKGDRINGIRNEKQITCANQDKLR